MATTTTVFSIVDVQSQVNALLKDMNLIFYKGLGNNEESHTHHLTLHIDHIGIDCATHDEFVAICDELRNSNLIEGEYAETIRNRNVAVFKLRQPLTRLSVPWTSPLPEHACRYIEVSDQDAEMSQVSGISHIEMSYYGQGTFGDSIFAKCLRNQGSVFQPKERTGFKHPLLYLSLPQQGRKEPVKIYFITGEGIKNIIEQRT